MLKYALAFTLIGSTAVLAQTEKPIDKGPFTPQANAAYQGGGVVLQGAPGAPAPTPQATPAGQSPTGAVAPLPPGTPAR